MDPPVAAAGEEAGEETKPAAVAAPEATEVEDAEAAFDSNHITPGTEFMARVSEMLRYFIRYKLQNDELWRGAQQQRMRRTNPRPPPAEAPTPADYYGHPSRCRSRVTVAPYPRRNNARAPRRALGRRGARRGRAQDHGAHPLGSMVKVALLARPQLATTGSSDCV